MFVVVLVFVVQYGSRQLQLVNLREIAWSPGWLLLAMLCYFAGWIPAAMVWGRLLNRAGHSLHWYTLLRAHFCGHVGKYVPGKAVVLVIRAGLLRSHQVPMAIAGVTATAETLMTMAMGLAITLTLLPVLLGNYPLNPQLESIPGVNFLAGLSTTGQWLTSLLIVVVTILVIPVCCRLLEWVTRKLMKKSKSTIESEFKMSFPEAMIDLTLLGIGWIMNGLSLGVVMLSIGTMPQSAADVILWVAAVSAATSVGFLVLFAPGGLGVREGLLMGILQLSPQVDAAHAVLIAVLVRLVSLFSEILFGLLLYAVPDSNQKASVGSNESE